MTAWYSTGCTKKLKPSWEKTSLTRATLPSDTTSNEASLWKDQQASCIRAPSTSSTTIWVSCSTDKARKMILEILWEPLRRMKQSSRSVFRKNKNSEGKSSHISSRINGPNRQSFSLRNPKRIVSLLKSTSRMRWRFWWMLTVLRATSVIFDWWILLRKFKMRGLKTEMKV